MTTPPRRFSQLRWLQNVTCIAATVGAIVLIGLGLIDMGLTEATGRAWMLVAGGFLLFLALITMTFFPLVLKMESSLARHLDVVRDLHDIAEKQASLLASIAANTYISDAAKSLAHREQEIEALRGAIRNGMREGHWEAALNLIDEMEQRFGFKEEADRFREELDDARNEAIEARLREAILLIEKHFEVYDWERAEKEIDRLLQALPDNAKVLALQDRIKVLKEQHKQDILLQWEEAVRRSDTDQAIDILKELDQYLSVAEAQSLQSSARHMFKEKLLRLGVQFRFAVMEKRWQDALTVGMELVREFPNARMATEVREALDTLRARARAASEVDAART